MKFAIIITLLLGALTGTGYYLTTPGASQLHGAIYQYQASKDPQKWVKVPDNHTGPWTQWFSYQKSTIMYKDGERVWELDWADPDGDPLRWVAKIGDDDEVKLGFLFNENFKSEVVKSAYEEGEFGTQEQLEKYWHCCGTWEFFHYEGVLQSIKLGEWHETKTVIFNIDEDEPMVDIRSQYKRQLEYLEKVIAVAYKRFDDENVESFR